jgi:hypothetical protein
MASAQLKILLRLGDLGMFSAVLKAAVSAVVSVVWKVSRDTGTAENQGLSNVKTGTETKRFSNIFCRAETIVERFLKIRATCYVKVLIRRRASNFIFPVLIALLLASLSQVYLVLIS